MNLILKAINKEKSTIRQFPVSFSKEPRFAVIYDILPEHDSYLPALVDGIKSMSGDTVEIFCTESDLFSEIQNVKKLKWTEETVEVIEPKKSLTDINDVVK
jgi:hypothetical protein